MITPEDFNIYYFEMKFGFFPSRDMHTPHSPVSFDPVFDFFADDAQYAETNKKSIFRFLFFELL